MDRHAGGLMRWDRGLIWMDRGDRGLIGMSRRGQRTYLNEQRERDHAHLNGPHPNLNVPKRGPAHLNVPKGPEVLEWPCTRKQSIILLKYNISNLSELILLIFLIYNNINNNNKNNNNPYPNCISIWAWNNFNIRCSLSGVCGWSVWISHLLWVQSSALCVCVDLL